jgi:hypothetical protein
MKREFGWAAAAVAAITAIGIAVPSRSPTPSSQQDAAATASAPGGYRGPCKELRALFTDFFSLPESASFAPATCDVSDPAHPSAARATPHPAAAPTSLTAHSARFIIATLPDPVHTHLPLLFDRNAEAIQQAAQDEHFTYDSSWLPWEPDTTASSSSSDEKDRSAWRRDLREDQPGILLFRRALEDSAPATPPSAASSASPAPPGPFADTLVVFVVSEEPTSGIQREQFRNAVRWIQSLTAGAVTLAPGGIAVLGPDFSGSIPSLAQLLNDPAVASLLRAQQPLRVYGIVSSNEGVRWLTAPTRLPGYTLAFKSFKQDDATTSERYFRFLDHVGLPRSMIAIVAEDGTAYGQPASAKSTDIVTFRYPRDISALRSAYQKQALFRAPSSSSLSSSASSDPTRHTLLSDLADGTGEQTDAVRSYAGAQTAMSEEAVLLQIVDLLRSHQSRYIILKSSNPLDQLFLAHFFQHTYPEGRIVVLGNDLLLRRETGQGGLIGLMTLSSYPLLTDVDDWEATTDPLSTHTHRVFAHFNSEATYIALRFLLHSPPTDCLAGDAVFVPANCDPGEFVLPDYSRPTWLPATDASPNRPLTWLTVLGNAGFLPVAALDDPIPPTERLRGHLQTCPEPQRPVWPIVPLSLRIALVLLIAGSFFHAYCCMRASITVKPDYRANFVRTFEPFHRELIVLGSALVSIISIILAWSYGFMSPRSAPLSGPKTIIYFFTPVFIWLISLFAVVASEWVERRLANPKAQGKLWPFKGRAVIGGPLRAYIPSAAFSIALYVLLTGTFWVLCSVLVDQRLYTPVRTLTYIRSMNLTSGVSPALPLLLLALGMYGWFWFSLGGQVVLGTGKPLLPRLHDLCFFDDNKQPLNLLTPLSRERVSTPMDKISFPLNAWAFRTVILTCLLIFAIASFVVGAVPIRALGNRYYSLFVFLWLTLSVSILATNVLQFLRIWFELRPLLKFLDKLPLRRTFRVLSGFSWGSIWRIGGNILDMRYKVLYRQFEALIHLKESLALATATPVPSLHFPPDADGVKEWTAAITETEKARTHFATWYADSWDQWKARDTSTLCTLQGKMASTAGIILGKLLIPAWRKETDSLLIDTHTSGSPHDDTTEPDLSPDLYIRNAEEFVCLVFLGFIQNVLARMRSIVMGIICLFLSIAFVVSSYPFDPRTILSASVVILFLVICIAVFLVYSQMFRDSTLSHLTNTRPGELGSEFWLKFLSFGIGPIFGLLTTVLPEFGSFFLSWLQPSLSSLK